MPTDPHRTAEARAHADEAAREAEIVAAFVDPSVAEHNATIHLEEYNPEWTAWFDREARRVREALGESVLLLEHVGSTSIPGMAAKPRIDMLLVVPDSSDEPSYVPALEARGYQLVIREPEWHEHRVFKGPDSDVNLHVFSPGSVEIQRMRGFRDWLRVNPQDFELYLRTKRELSARAWKYVQNYADAKSKVVGEISARAGLPPGIDEPTVRSNDASGQPQGSLRRD
jgi:GrpB-like predicted nucleotidyltransferase (UPF0157 family)